MKNAAKTEGEAGNAEPRKLPSPEEACLRAPLYRVLASGADIPDFLAKLNNAALRYDAYCVGCEREATFRRDFAGVPLRLPAVHIDHTKLPQVQVLIAACTRRHHFQFFVFAPYRGGIAKIGQSPSLADLVAEDLRRYREVLDKSDLSELETASRLFSHGVAIGAFVYLRRIFERLLGRARDEYSSNHGPLKPEPKSTEEWVLALKEFLPKEVVDNRKAYGILSKGIHELDEDSCERYYPVMRAVIMEILQREISRREEAKASAELRNAVASIVGEIKG
jgi:hypothetical protein